jgi:AcrR family transcriptional regulator
MRQVRAEETRNALLLAAAQIFDRDGYEGTTLATVSDRAEQGGALVPLQQ